MKKRVLWIGIMTVLALTAAGCGSQQDVFQETGPVENVETVGDSVSDGGLDTGKNKEDAANDADTQSAEDTTEAAQ